MFLLGSLFVFERVSKEYFSKRNQEPSHVHSSMDTLWPTRRDVQEERERTNLLAVNMGERLGLVFFFLPLFVFSPNGFMG